MSDDQTTERAWFAEPFQIAIQDANDRADLWLDLAKEFLRLGWLCEALRGPQQLHAHIHAAASLCRSNGYAEINRSAKFLKGFRAHLDVLSASIPRSEVDGDWAE